MSCDAGALADALAAARVGGAFWAARPDLPAGRDLLLAPAIQAEARALCDAAKADAGRALLVGPFAAWHGIPVLSSLCDPWALASAAAEVRGSDSELALVGSLLGKHAADRVAQAGRLISGWAYRDPFTGRPISALDAVTLLAEWRELIDANRDIAGVLGVARWKRVTMDALLWGGSGPVPHRGARTVATIPDGARVAAWKTRSAPGLVETLAARGVAVGEIEDGMIRSAGLGANCVPPLSVIVDPRGAHFDPAQPSTLEHILQHDDIGPDLVARAAALRQRLVASGISKYAQATAPAARLGHGGRRLVLVTGQVEDDRAVLLGGAGCSNRDLLARARAAEPDAELVYKPHPDVEAGHRKGHIPEAEVLALADRIDRSRPIAALLGQVDALHVISSLAGFEALLRGVAVTTHGIPFYAGWGLTRDLGPVPARRNRARTLDELVAAVLILYPRYLDPVTRLPCPVEVLVERMASGQAAVTSPLVRLREWQGRAQKLLRRP
ncbi:MAG: beta-3-deoxy-D-manno-oct-2-ulosonic acid transferase [Sphingomonadales bacterium]|nr:beta-3-deoxy-D-manno-oct-2-ulosonic acid transferase [Sphingomonadales bacterium]